jgi:hypothetical protein
MNYCNMVCTRTQLIMMEGDARNCIVGICKRGPRLVARHLRHGIFFSWSRQCDAGRRCRFRWRRIRVCRFRSEPRIAGLHRRGPCSEQDLVYSLKKKAAATQAPASVAVVLLRRGRTANPPTQLWQPSIQYSRRLGTLKSRPPITAAGTAITKAMTTQTQPAQ